MILNLDKNFKPISGLEIQYESFTFSGGEPHIKIKNFNNSEAVIVTHRVNSFNDLGLLSITIDALQRMGVTEIELVLPYFPGARQDRVMTSGESLSVKVYADLINGYNLKSIKIYDPHSEVTPALLNNCIVINNHDFIAHLIEQLPKDILLVSPDAGALKKIHKLASHLKDYQVLECGKSRDVATGALSGFTVPVKDLEGRDCLIIDDICDGGGTFLGLAQELKKCNAGKLYLAVSHGIFSKGFEELGKQFKEIYTTDSFRTIENIEFLKQIKLESEHISLK